MIKRTSIEGLSPSTESYYKNRNFLEKIVKGGVNLSEDEEILYDNDYLANDYLFRRTLINAIKKYASKIVRWKDDNFDDAFCQYFTTEQLVDMFVKVKKVFCNMQEKNSKQNDSNDERFDKYLTIEELIHFDKKPNKETYYKNIAIADRISKSECGFTDKVERLLFCPEYDYAFRRNLIYMIKKYASKDYLKSNDFDDAFFQSLTNDQLADMLIETKRMCDQEQEKKEKEISTYYSNDDDTNNDFIDNLKSLTIGEFLDIVRQAANETTNSSRLLNGEQKLTILRSFAEICREIMQKLSDIDNDTFLNFAYKSLFCVY